MNEAKVAELEDKVSRAEVIDPAKLSGSTVKFGATVTLEDEDSGDKVKYKIVGEHEANVREGKISITSPIARALIGKSKGDSAEVTDATGRAQLRDPEDRIQIGTPKAVHRVFSPGVGVREGDRLLQPCAMARAAAELAARLSVDLWAMSTPYSSSQPCGSYRGLFHTIFEALKGCLKEF